MGGITERPVLPRAGGRHCLVVMASKMTHDHTCVFNALKSALMLAWVGGGLGHAATVSSNVYTLRVGDSQASVVNGVLFDGRYIWGAVQNPDGGTLVKITQTGVILSSTPVGSGPDGMAYDGANIWVTDYSSNDVTIVSAGGNVVKTIELPSANPEGILFDGKYIWVANNGAGANSLSKFDAVSQTLVATYPVGLDPDGVAFDGTAIWVTNSYSNNVWKINRDTGAYIDSYSTGIFPTSVVYDGANIWVGNGTGTGVDVGSPVSGVGTVAKIRAADGTILGTYTVGNHVRGLVYDGTSIWVCNANDNTVSRLRASKVALLGTFATGKGPRAVAFDGSKIWIANSGENSLTVIAPVTPGSTGDTSFARGANRSAAFGGVGYAGPPNTRNFRIPIGRPGRSNGITPEVVAQREVVAGGSISPMLDLILDTN